jgi:hypothetical protein
MNERRIILSFMVKRPQSSKYFRMLGTDLENQSAVPTSKVSKPPSTVKAGSRGLYAVEDAFVVGDNSFPFLTELCVWHLVCSLVKISRSQSLIRYPSATVNPEMHGAKYPRPCA